MSVIWGNCYILLKHDVRIMDDCPVIMFSGILAAPFVVALHMLYICYSCSVYVILQSCCDYHVYLYVVEEYVL